MYATDLKQIRGRKKDTFSQLQIELWTTEYNKEIYIKHKSETVSGSAFIWWIKPNHNSCGTEPWQRDMRRGH